MLWFSITTLSAGSTLSLYPYHIELQADSCGQATFLFSLLYNFPTSLSFLIGNLRFFLVFELGTEVGFSHVVTER